MIDKLKDVIKENLPQQVGEELQKELARIPVMEKRIAELEEQVRSRDNAIAMHAKDKVSLQTQLEAAGKLDEREDAVTKREHQVALIEVKAECAELRRKDAVDLVTKIFEGPIMRRRVTADHPVVVPGTSGFAHPNGSISYGDAPQVQPGQTTTDVEEQG